MCFSLLPNHQPKLIPPPSYRYQGIRHRSSQPRIMGSGSRQTDPAERAAPAGRQVHQDHQRRVGRRQVHHQRQAVCKVCGGSPRQCGADRHRGGHESRVSGCIEMWLVLVKGTFRDHRVTGAGRPQFS